MTQNPPEIAIGSRRKCEHMTGGARLRGAYADTAHQGGKRHRSELLDQFVAMAGYSRKCLMMILAGKSKRRLYQLHPSREAKYTMADQNTILAP